MPIMQRTVSNKKHRKFMAKNQTLRHSISHEHSQLAIVQSASEL